MNFNNLCQWLSYDVLSHLTMLIYPSVWILIFFDQFSILRYGFWAIIKNHLVRICYYSIMRASKSAFIKIKMCRNNCDFNFFLTLFDRLEYKVSLSLWHLFEYSVTTEHLASIAEIFAKIVDHLAMFNRFFPAGIYLFKVNN